jgi:hypothetical protein
MPPLLDICHSLDPVSFARERLRSSPDPTYGGWGQAAMISCSSLRPLRLCATKFFKVFDE